MTICTDSNERRCGKIISRSVCLSLAFCTIRNNGIFQLFKNGCLLQFNGEVPVAVYSYESDPLLKENLLDKVDYQEDLLLLKSFIQQYMERMIDRDGLSIVSGSDNF